MCIQCVYLVSSGAAPVTSSAVNSALGVTADPDVSPFRADPEP